ncbi:valine N-monooxygenase 1-like protein [Tanacetum coccineum]
MSDHWKKMRKTLSRDILSVARHNWLQTKRNEEVDNLIRNGGPGAEEIEHVDSLWTILNYLYAFSVTDYFPWLRWITDFDGHEKIMRDAIRTARKYQDRLVDERIQQWKDGVRVIEDDLLDVFINLKNPRLTADQIKAQILELALATFDNPSNGIEWAMAEMINQPRIIEKAIQELDSVVGIDRWVQEYDLPNLNYIKACVREAFRLHPVAPFNVPHVSSVDTTVAGYFIPKGSHVLLSRPGLGRNPEVWDDPLTYDPDRHMKRVLLGSTMTIMLLARLLQEFTWGLPSNELHVDLKENLEDLSKAKPFSEIINVMHGVTSQRSVEILVGVPFGAASHQVPKRVPEGTQFTIWDIAHE